MRDGRLVIVEPSLLDVLPFERTKWRYQNYIVVSLELDQLEFIQQGILPRQLAFIDLHHLAHLLVGAVILVEVIPD